MKIRYLGVTTLAGAALLLIGCNQTVPPAPAENTTTIVPVPVPGEPGPPGPQGPQGPEGPPGPPPAESPPPAK
jgi:hypothetical protein